MIRESQGDQIRHGAGLIVQIHQSDDPQFLLGEQPYIGGISHAAAGTTNDWHAPVSSNHPSHAVTGKARTTLSYLRTEVRTDQHLTRMQLMHPSLAHESLTVNLTVGQM